MAVAIPEKFRDLFEKPIVVALVTVMPDGQPQATPVWAIYDGTYVIVNTARGRQKDKNMQRDAKVTVLVIDPANPYHWVEVRGRIADESEETGLEVINALSAKYRGEPDYYKRNETMRGKETRVTYKIEPLNITPKG
ncbi:MAG: PPOX class F420-dependent oxidoreductase [Chloroflexota bacterium]